MVEIETKLFGITIHKEQVNSPTTIQIPTAYQMKPGEKLCLQDDGSGFKWVRVKVDGVQVLNNPVPRDVRLGFRVPVPFFITKRLVLSE